ncbi:MAG: CtsR family transcriptional regulator [Synergistaceae bacterium]|nr:CtsR family transcriptional regulator [Synergistaceae bacterium]
MENYENNLSSGIEKYILELFDDDNDENSISLRRKDLAEMFGCVPSQINYVLRSRFSQERGYLIESRRGEYGYIKILRISCNAPQDKINHFNDIVGDEISVRGACRLLEALNERGLITERERLLIEIALKNQSSNHSTVDSAKLLKKMLSVLVS